MLELNVKNVHNIFTDCMFKDNPKPGTKFIPGWGITVSVGFDPERIEKHASEIKEMLDNLPDDFKAEKGGGMSFLEACVTKDGNHWGEHKDMQELMLLGLASGYVKYLIANPQMWHIFPGNVPYFMVLDKRNPVEMRIFE
jgi:hypothetical protein